MRNDLEIVKCEICGRQSSKIIARGHDFEYGTLDSEFYYMLCKDCNHIYLKNRPDSSLINKIYPRTYYTVNVNSPLFLKGNIHRNKLKFDIRRIKQNAELVSLGKTMYFASQSLVILHNEIDRRDEKA